MPLLLSLAGPWGARLRSDVRRFNVWTKGEVQWLRKLGGVDGLKLDKFNPGQKLNALFVAGGLVLFRIFQLATAAA